MSDCRGLRLSVLNKETNLLTYLAYYLLRGVLNALR